MTTSPLTFLLVAGEILKFLDGVDVTINLLCVE
jgi:hypothetical protein